MTKFQDVAHFFSLLSRSFNPTLFSPSIVLSQHDSSVWACLYLGFGGRDRRLSTSPVGGRPEIARARRTSGSTELARARRTSGSPSSSSGGRISTSPSSKTGDNYRVLPDKMIRFYISLIYTRHHEYRIINYRRKNKHRNRTYSGIYIYYIINDMKSFCNWMESCP